MLCQNAGDCICREGYCGAQCDECAYGYTGYPDCTRCPCNVAGSVNDDICQQCVCKVTNISIFFYPRSSIFCCLQKSISIALEVMILAFLCRLQLQQDFEKTHLFLVHCIFVLVNFNFVVSLYSSWNFSSCVFYYNALFIILRSFCVCSFEVASVFFLETIIYVT